MDKFGAMETFVRIVEKGSLTAAANALDTSLPTVVRILASLERSLGVMLLHRTTLRIAHLKDSSLVAIPVGKVRRVVCATEQYLRSNGIPKVPDDIRKHRCVRHTGLAPRSEWHFKIGRRNVSIPVISRVSCNEIDT